MACTPILTGREAVTYEGQGAILLEAMAEPCEDAYPVTLEEADGVSWFDFRPMVREMFRELAENLPAAQLAAKFMNTLVALARVQCLAIREKTRRDQGGALRRCVPKYVPAPKGARHLDGSGIPSISSSSCVCQRRGHLPGADHDRSERWWPVMCLAIPFQIVKIEGNTAIAEAAGVQRKVRIDFIKEPKVGDFIIVHAGFAIEKMKEEQALLNLEAISEAANAV